MPLRSMIIASALMVATLSIASADTYEPNTNRPGGDYKNFEVRSPGDCETSCVHDARCKAWTWVKKGIQGPAARCWLKASVPQPVPDKNCVSGRKGGYTF
jgi:hypothetical protein